MLCHIPTTSPRRQSLTEIKLLARCVQSSCVYGFVKNPLSNLYFENEVLDQCLFVFRYVIYFSVKQSARGIAVSV